MFLAVLGLLSSCRELELLSSCRELGLLSSCRELGLLSSLGVQASHYGGFSCCGAQALGHMVQGLNPCLLHWQADSLPLSIQGSSFPFLLLMTSLPQPSLYTSLPLCTTPQEPLIIFILYFKTPSLFLFVAQCGMCDLSSLTRDRTRATCIGSVES